MNWYAKQEQEIFQEDFDPKKCKTVNRKQYVNNATRKYDDDESESEEPEAGQMSQEEDPLDKLQNGTSLDSERSEDESSEGSTNLVSKKKGRDQDRVKVREEKPKRDMKDKVFDMAREKNLSNRVFSLGENREAHKRLEKAAKEKRQKKKGGKEMENGKGEDQPRVSTQPEKNLAAPHRKQKKLPNTQDSFQKHSDSNEVEKCLKKGEYFEGVIKMNAANRNRAYVHVKDFRIDVLVDGLKNMNRAMDGDQVAIWLERTKWWNELPQSSQQKAGKDGDTNQVGYSNEQAIESRVVDKADQGDSKEKPRNAKMKEESKENDTHKNKKEPEEDDEDDGW